MDSRLLISFIQFSTYHTCNYGQVLSVFRILDFAPGRILHHEISPTAIPASAKPGVSTKETRSPPGALLPCCPVSVAPALNQQQVVTSPPTKLQRAPVDSNSNHLFNQSSLVDIKIWHLRRKRAKIISSRKSVLLDGEFRSRLFFLFFYHSFFVSFVLLIQDPQNWDNG